MEPRADCAIVVIGERMPANLDEVARLHQTAAVLVSSSQAGLESLSLLRPRLVLLGVTGELDEACRLITGLATSGRRVRIIAAVEQHADWVERALRAAGATYYLPDMRRESLSSFLRALGAVAPHQRAGESGGALVTGHWAEFDEQAPDGPALRPVKHEEGPTKAEV